MAPMTKKKSNLKCIKCNLLLHKVTGTKKKIETEEDAKEFTEKIKKTVIIGDVLCGKCFLKYNYNQDYKNDNGEDNKDDSSMENNESGKSSCNSPSKTNSFDWQDSSSPSEASDDPDFELSADESVDEGSEGPSNAKCRKMQKFNFGFNSFISSKNVMNTETKSFHSLLKNTLAELGSKSNEISKSSNNSFGCSSLVNNLAFDYKPKQIKKNRFVVFCVEKKLISWMCQEMLANNIFHKNIWLLWTMQSAVSNTSMTMEELL